jgi:hypothetical protein
LIKPNLLENNTLWDILLKIMDKIKSGGSWIETLKKNTVFTNFEICDLKLSISIFTILYENDISFLQED